MRLQAYGPQLSSQTMSTQLRPLSLWSRVKPLAPCSARIPDPQYNEHNKIVTALLLFYYSVTKCWGVFSFSTIIDNGNNLTHSHSLVNIHFF